MAVLLPFYLVLLAVGLSLFHSYRIIQRGYMVNATVNAVQLGRREKKLLLWALGSSVVYAVGVLLMTFLREDTSVYIVLTPIWYLLVWSVPRLFLERLD
jgi:uncharacterized membrane protein YhdT